MGTERLFGDVSFSFVVEGLEFDRGEMASIPRVDDEVAAASESAPTDDGGQGVWCTKVGVGCNGRHSPLVLRTGHSVPARMGMPLANVSDRPSAPLVDSPAFRLLPLVIRLEAREPMPGLRTWAEDVTDNNLRGITPPEERAACLADVPPTSLGQKFR